MTAVIQTEALTKSYGSARGIVDVDLEVTAGQCFGFLGPNGAGKTTTMRVLLDFIRPTSGRARIFGLDSRADSVAIHRGVGYLAGDVALYERLTARQLFEWLGRLRAGVARPAFEELAERLGLELDRPIRALSSGNQQKVALVQAFMHQPDLLVLDEPTVGLDPLVQQTFQAMVREVAEAGRTVFLSSHVIDEVERLCDRVGFIRDGRLVAVETVAALRTRSLREVTIRFAGPVATDEFEALPGARDVTVEDRTIRLRFEGPPDALVKLAARHEVADLVSAPVDLEEVFLTFYRAEGGSDAPRHR